MSSASLLALVARCRALCLLLATLLLMTSPQVKPVTEEPKKAEARRARTDRHGDSLPDGAIARLGTVRWRHGYMVEDLAYSPDGKSIAVVGGGRDITLWDAETGKEICQFPNRIDQPTRVAFSPDGKILATADRLSKLCRLWDVAAGKELRQLRGHQNDVRGIAFSPDGKRIATASADETIRLWDLAGGKEQLRIDAAGQVGRLAYSLDGKWIATASWDGIIHLWDPATGKEQRRLDAPNKASGRRKAIGNIVFSPDGKRLASSSRDGTIRLWDMTAFKQSHVLAGKKENDEIPIAFSPDGVFLASGHEDGTIRLWDVRNGTEKRRWQAGVANVHAVAFSPDSKTLASGGHYWGAIGLWDVATGREKHPSQEHHGSVASLRFSPDGRSLISIGRDEGVLRWDLATNKPRQQFSWKRNDIGPVALSSDGNTLAMCPWPKPNEVRLLDLPTGQRRRLRGNEEDFVNALAFSSNGRLLAMGEGVDGDGQVIHIRDLRNGKEVRQIKGFRNNVECLCFSPDSKVLACGMWMWGDARSQRALYLWDIASGKELFHLDDHQRGPHTPIAFSPDSKVLATVAIDRDESSNVLMWHIETGKELCRHTGHREWVGSVAFSPDGKLIASGTSGTGKDSSVHLWEAATGRLIRRFEGHHSGVTSVAFSPDGWTVASGAGDSTILLWDITGRAGIPPTPMRSPRELDACWADLTNEDAAKAYDAVWRFIAAPEQAVPFLRKHLSPVPRPDAKAIARWIADLDSDDFAVRQKAMEELNKLGRTVASALRGALQGKPSLEMRRRVQQLLDQSHDWTQEQLRVHRAIQVLERIGTQPAREILQALAEGAPESRCTEGAKAAQRRLNR